jgi:type II secretory pathway pseudopilin PulG
VLAVRVAGSIRTGRTGMTLVESMIGITLFAILGYALSVAVSISNNSQRTVLNVAAEGRDLRGATQTFIRELRASSDARITITVLPDLNHQVDFMMPIDVAGAATWGVYDRTLGPDAATQNRLNWILRYTVRDVVDPAGGVDKQLVRQILDDLGAVQRTKVLATGLRMGGVAPAGFRMVRQGAIWEVTLSTNSQGEGQAGIRTVFHVRTRN